jgi:hypothetical protein
LRTLFAPWKGIRDDYPAKGFDLEKIAENWALNMTSRTIGFLFRIGAIFISILMQCALLAGFALYLVLWMLYPLLIIAGMPVIIATLIV